MQGMLNREDCDDDNVCKFVFYLKEEQAHK